MTIIVAILVLGVLVFIHELGHFLLAKACGVGVVEFSVGFGKKIWKKKIGETSYAVGIVPLGGYVRMVGDDPREFFGSAAEDQSETPKPPLEERSRWFLEKGYFAKVAIVIAGPGFNVLLALLLSIGSFAWFGLPVIVDEPIIRETIPNYPAQKAGLRSGDRITSIGAEAIETWKELAETIARSGGRELVLTVERTNDLGKQEILEVRIAGTRESVELSLLDDSPSAESFKIGILPEAKRRSASLGESVKFSCTHLWYLSKITVQGIGLMLVGAISPTNIAGPIYIFQEAGRTAKKGVESLLDFVIFLSISLAILNLLPIPILDGGHLLFFTIEALKGSPVSLRVQEVANQVGMLLLLLLMVFAIGNDIARIYQKIPQ